MRIELIREFSQIAARAQAWDDLAGAAGESNPFFERWMLVPALEELAHGRVWLLLIWSQPPPDGQLIGLFPISRSTGYRFMPLSYFTVWKHLHCYLSTPLIRSGYEQACLALLLDWAKAQGELLFEFKFIDEDGPLSQAILSLPQAQERSRIDVLERFPRALLKPYGDAETYLSQVVQSKHLRDIKRKLRTLDESGYTRIESIAPDDDIDAWIECFLTLEKVGWKGLSGTALAQREADKRFFEKVVSAAFSRSQLIMRKLMFDETPLAISVAFQARQTVFIFKIAFNEKFSKFSPGLLLEVENLEFYFNNSAIAQVDSCTSPDNAILNRLWRDRRTITSLIVSPHSDLGAGIITLTNSLRRLVHVAKSAIHPRAM